MGLFRESAAMTESSNLVWQRSSYCSTGTCVEVALSDENIILRDSKNKEGPTLTFQPSEWNAFLNGVKSGKFDLPLN
jgi:hypothetical protein